MLWIYFDSGLRIVSTTFNSLASGRWSVGTVLLQACFGLLSPEKSAEIISSLAWTTVESAALEELGQVGQFRLEHVTCGARDDWGDVDFIVPADNETPADIKLAFVYTDDVKDGSKLTDHLNARVHPTYRSRGVVRPYNAGMSREYRTHVMALFKAGIARVLV
ncbi:hypothetical protein B0H13DRAFT_2683450 [Mycena leptocephala]|nr:hypothetical protein B0H13DRAFT_2683450 [Mycena leptocephala]